MFSYGVKYVSLFFLSKPKIIFICFFYHVLCFGKLLWFEILCLGIQKWMNIKLKEPKKSNPKRKVDFALKVYIFHIKIPKCYFRQAVQSQASTLWEGMLEIWEQRSNHCYQCKHVRDMTTETELFKRMNRIRKCGKNISLKTNGVWAKPRTIVTISISKNVKAMCRDLRNLLRNRSNRYGFGYSD